jgi:hypothetical protein
MVVVHLTMMMMIQVVMIYSMMLLTELCLDLLLCIDKSVRVSNWYMHMILRFANVLQKMKDIIVIIKCDMRKILL